MGTNENSNIMTYVASDRHSKKRIFGKTYEFEWTHEFSTVVAGSIDLYENASANSPPDVKIFISRELPDGDLVSINPKIHQHLKKEMRTLFGRVQASWQRSTHGQPIKIGMAVPAIPPWKKWPKKLHSMEFSTEIEQFEQLLHELILVPSIYLFKDIAPIHAASIGTPSGAVLVAGTGGVGKSSAMIALRGIEGNRFIADDISIISGDAIVYGNMAWPKIYGYNCAGNDMAHNILDGRSFIDKLHFNVRNKVNPSNVRRKLTPDKLYDVVSPGASPIRALYYLVREKVPEIAVSSLSIECAVEMSVAVMESEYAVFHRHLHWEEYNALAGESSPLITMGEIRKNWRTLFFSAFSQVQLYKVGIPLDIDHPHFQAEISRILTTEVGDARTY